MRRIDLSVGACIVKDGEVLLLYHNKLEKWLFPGGHVEPNETPDMAVVREVKEETGLDFEFFQFSSLEKAIDEIQTLALPFHTNLHNVGDHDHYGAYYLGTVSRFDFVRNNESRDMRWVSRAELDDLKLTDQIRGMALYALESEGKYNGKR